MDSIFVLDLVQVQGRMWKLSQLTRLRHRGRPRWAGLGGGGGVIGIEVGPCPPRLPGALRGGAMLPRPKVPAQVQLEPPAARAAGWRLSEGAKSGSAGQAMTALIRMERTYGTQGLAGGVMWNCCAKLLRVIMIAEKSGSDPSLTTQWIFETIQLDLHTHRSA